MAITAYPDPNKRAGGRWSTPDLVDDLLLLAILERAVAHLIAGWVPKVANIDDKLTLAAWLEEAIGRAIALRHHALALLERDVGALNGSRDIVEPLQVLDRSTDPTDVVDGLLGGVRSFQCARYRELYGQLDCLYDARLRQAVGSAIGALAEGRSSASVRIGRSQELTPATAALVAELEGAWSNRRSGRIPVDEALWPPLDRVPRPERPPGRWRPEGGSLANYPVDSRREPHNVARSLNESVTAELCAMELMSRCSYEHPDLPWAFHTGAARHAADEARHAAIFRRVLAERGFMERDMPQHATSYEFGYEFPECAPGSKHELVWRLLLLGTVLEGLAIDKVRHEVAMRDWLGQPDIARAHDYTLADELFHTENALRWTRRLCASYHLDPMVERERVHGRFLARELDVRTRYLGADPERAAREIAMMERPDPDLLPFVSRTEFELRARAGFTSEESDQADRWAYNAPAE